MELRIAASAAIFRDGKLLLCKRGDSERYFAGAWTFPGGKLEEDQLLKDVVEREVHEETGLVFTVQEAFNFYEMKTDEFHNVSHVFLGSAAGEVVIDDDEVVEADWFSYEEAKELRMAFAYAETVEELHKRGLF